MPIILATHVSLRQHLHRHRLTLTPPQLPFFHVRPSQHYISRHLPFLPRSNSPTVLDASAAGPTASHRFPSPPSTCSPSFSMLYLFLWHLGNAGLPRLVTLSLVAQISTRFRTVWFTQVQSLLYTPLISNPPSRSSFPRIVPRMPPLAAFAVTLEYLISSRPFNTTTSKLLLLLFFTMNTTRTKIPEQPKSPVRSTQKPMALAPRHPPEADGICPLQPQKLSQSWRPAGLWHSQQRQCSSPRKDSRWDCQVSPAGTEKHHPGAS